MKKIKVLILKIYIFFIIITFLIININLKIFKIKAKRSLYIYKKYINFCSNLKNYYRKKIYNENPFISICLPVYNMKKYIERVIFSIINQSFQDFEIIAVNDYSKDDTGKILKKLQAEDERIKVINHSKNFGVYRSRVDGLLLSKGKYVILMDPDDMILNPNLFQLLYNYISIYNLDIVEYKVYRFNEQFGLFEVSDNPYRNHYHNFDNDIIYQPELSNLFFLNKTDKNYTSVQCRAIWNKIIRKEIIINAIQYIGKDYYKKFFITAEDTLINLIIIHFAQNYSNIDLPGYMYNQRIKSITHGKRSKKTMKLFYYNYLLYFKKLYKYIKNFNKDRNILYFELKELKYMLSGLIKLDNKYKYDINNFYNDILKDKLASSNFKKYIEMLIKENN